MKPNLLTHDYSTALAGHSESPCLSLYQPTHRHHPGNQQDPLRFRNLVKQLEQSLGRKYPVSQIQTLLKPFEDLGANRDFWSHTLDGLVVLGSPSLFQVYGLQRSVPELVVVAKSFHTKPIRRFLQSADRFQILGLSLHEIKLFEGTRDTLDEVDLAPGVPRTITEALGEELTDPHQTVGAYGGTNLGGLIRHCHGGRRDERDIDAARFFRVVDRSIHEHHSRPSNLPLLLAALPEHHGAFRRISHNPFLLPSGIKIHPDVLPVEELRERAWQVFEPYYQASLVKLADEFRQAQAKGSGLDELPKIAEAAAGGSDLANRSRQGNRWTNGQRDGANSIGRIGPPGIGRLAR